MAEVLARRREAVEPGLGGEANASLAQSPDAVRTAVLSHAAEESKSTHSLT